MFPFVTSNIVLVQALISTELLCCVFYLIQWLFADFIISARARGKYERVGRLASGINALVCSSPVVTSHTQNRLYDVRLLQQRAL